LTVLLGIAASPFMPADLLGVLFTANFILQSLLNALGAYGIVVVSRSVFVYDDLTTGGRAVVFAFGAAFVCLSVLLATQNAARSQTARDGTLVVLAALAPFVLAAVVRYRIFTSGASAGHLTREQILDEMDAAVVIADRNGRILEYNAGFEAMFGVDGGDAVGDRLDAVTGSLSQGEKTLTTAGGARRCVVERTTLTTTAATQIGDAYRIRDVTDRRTREQRLDVLNRVLRHNLRNDLDAMKGFAETLETDADVDRAAIAARIEAMATDLSATGETVKRCARLLDRERRTDTVVDVTATAEEVAGRVADQYPGTVAVRFDERRTVQADPAWIEAILSEVVENGLKHGPGGDAHVDVVVEHTAEAVEVAVRDNGPGIPEREQAVLLDGEESPLRHGSGIGLWLVNWGLSRLGGQLSFREPERGGSVVTLTIPGVTT
jgi:signal transduction histidine kinase